MSTFKKIYFFLVFIGISISAQAAVFYKIEKDGMKAPSYIFGSHHLAPISIIEAAGVEPYFDASEQVIGELDLTVDQMQLSMQLQQYMVAPSDSTLSVLLGNEDLDVLNQQFVKWAPMPGMQLQMLEPLKPMAVTTMLALGMSKEAMPDFDPEHQLDSYFFIEGEKQGKKIIGLETPQFQGEILFNTTPLTVQAEALIDMLKNPDQALENSKQLAEKYKNRDLDGMFELSQSSEDHPEFMELILDKRNEKWMTQLPQLINETPSFIVVGALHLAGPNGILKGLENLGYTLTPIY